MGVYDQILKEGTCTLEEGGGDRSHRLAPGGPVHREHAPTSGTPTIALGDPAVHVAAGTACTSCPRAISTGHFQHYATYELVDPATGKVWQAAKRGFCMIDVVPWNGGHSVARFLGISRVRRAAGALGAAIVGNQGISTGRAINTTSGSAGSISSWMEAMQAAVPAGTVIKYRTPIHVTRRSLHQVRPGPQRPVDPQGMCQQLLREPLRQQRGRGSYHAPRESPRQDRLRPGRRADPA